MQTAAGCFALFLPAKRCAETRQSVEENFPVALVAGVPVRQTAC